MAQFHYQVGDESKTVRVEREGTAFAVTIDEQRYIVHVQPGVAGRLHLAIDGERTTAFVATDGNRADPRTHVWLDGNTWTLHRTTGRRRRQSGPQQESTGNITAPMPGQIIALLVTVGDQVAQGDPLVMLSAMKMETRLTAPHAGVVQAIGCAEGDTVERGQLLVLLTPMTEAASR